MPRNPASRRAFLVLYTLHPKGGESFGCAVLPKVDPGSRDIAVGIGIVASKANANAAKAVGLPVLIFSALLALILAALGLSA